MNGWVGDVYRPREQREALLAFADAIGAKRRLGEDEAGNPRIEGKHGRIYAVPSNCDRFQIYVFGSSTRWRWAKEALRKIGRLANDGDEDGMFVINRLPAKAQGEVLRDKLGIFKRVEYSEEVLARKRENIRAARAKRDKILDGGRDGDLPDEEG